MSVDVPFRGIEGGEVEVTTGLGGGDRGFGFDQTGRFSFKAFDGLQLTLSASIDSRGKTLHSNAVTIQVTSALSPIQLIIPEPKGN